MRIRNAIILVMITALAVILGYWLGVILPARPPLLATTYTPETRS